MNKPVYEIARNKRKGKIRLFLFLILLSMLAIVFRLFYLQVHENSHFSELGERNFLRTEMIPSMRGNVCDCYGKLLATNTPVFDLYWNGAGRHHFSELQKKYLDTIESILGSELCDKKVKRKIRSAERFSRQVLIKKNLSHDEICCISEQCSESANLQIAKRFKRIYPYQTLACHILGYLRRVSATGNMRGLCGLERMFQDDLKGEYGYVKHVINATGKKLFQKDVRPAVAGDDVSLTLDLTMQSIAETLFSPGQAGAFIIMDPEDGAVRVMLSYPQFDPNLFLAPISDDIWHEQFTTDSPLLNRAIHALYPPASIFKLITFVAGFEEGIVSPDTEFECKGHTLFCGRKYNCHRRWGHGKVSAREALGLSCNIPCYEIAQKISIDQIAAYAMRFGLGMSTDFLFPDKRGLVPTSYWKQAHRGERWWKGETISVSIGQSFLQVTPLQIARMISAIASGYLVKPRILSSEEVERYPLYISPDTLKFLREVMRDVVQKGTAKWLKGFKDFTIHAKTGTAQTVSLQKQQRETKKQLEHAWFASYFSYKDEKPLTLVVLIENVGSSRPAQYIAKRFFKTYKNVLERSQR